MSTTRKPYSTDLTDAEWSILQLLLKLPTGGRPKTTNLREVINAIRYRHKTGCQWRLLPNDFPPEGTVRRYFHYFKRTGQFEDINDDLRKRVRVQEKRDEEPTLVIIDSQSVKATRTSGERGFDAGKKINGIKRHFMVDVLGLIICIVVHAANIQERAGAKLLLAKAENKGMPQLIKVLADDGYSGESMREHVREKHGWEFETVKRPELHKFVVMPKRWVVERTIGWMGNFRALSKDYDTDPKTGESNILLGSIHYMLRRLTNEPAVKEDWIDKANEEKLAQVAKK